MGNMPPRGGLNKGTEVPTVDVATTQGCANVTHVLCKTDGPANLGASGLGTSIPVLS
jgi:hypothetical protein